MLCLKQLEANQPLQYSDASFFVKGAARSFLCFEYDRSENLFLLRSTHFLVKGNLDRQIIQDDREQIADSRYTSTLSKLATL